MGSGPATSDQQTEVTASASASTIERQLLRKADVVGRYVVLSMLGAGGMGVVYAAYDPELDRKVALKLLHHEDAAPDGKRRLLREAQAMARLTHPSVVTVHDVGEHEGRVFVAMEYVDGVTVREWLRGRVRPWRDVLDIYLRAGRGLVAAHELGLVHRDFKPDNVMVTCASGDPDAPVERVRVMDFGLARAFAPLSDRETFDPDRNFRPRFDALDSNLTIGVAGTPAYMAPEQKADDPVDARADQFSFCVALWEGIYGERPFAVESLAELAIAQLSGRIQTPRRRGVPLRIRRTLERGLSPDPAQRFASMAELLAELERDPSRRRAAMGLVGAAVAIVAGTAGFLAFQRNRAEASCEGEGLAIAYVWNESERDRVRAGLTAASPELGAAMAERLEPVLDAYALAWHRARSETCMAAFVDKTMPTATATAATACLDESKARLDAFVDLLAEAQRDDVWDATETASKLPPVERCRDEAWLRVRPALPDDANTHLRVVEVREALQRGLSFGPTRAEDAVEALGYVVADARAVGWPPLVAEALLAHGLAVNSAGRHAEAESILFEAYLEALGAGDDRVAAEAASLLTIVVGYFLGRHDEGLVWGRTGKTLSKRIGDADAHLQARLLSAIGLVEVERGNFRAALDHHVESRQLWEASVGPEHVEVAREYSNIGLAHWKSGRYDDANAAFERSLALWNAAVGPEHPSVAVVLNNMGTVAMERGQLDDAERLYEEALAIRAATIGKRHAMYASTLSNLGSVAQTRQRNDEAIEYFEEALDIFAATVGAEHPRVAQIYTNMSNVYLAREDYDQAEATLLRAIEIIEKSLGPDHPNLGMPLANLGVVHETRGNVAEAKLHLQRAIDLFERGFGPHHSLLAVPLVALGEIALDEERWADAVDLLERALAIREQAGVTGKELAATQLRLAVALHALDRDPERVRSLATAARPAAAPEDVERIDALLAKLDG